MEATFSQTCLFFYEKECNRQKKQHFTANLLFMESPGNIFI